MSTDGHCLTGFWWRKAYHQRVESRAAVIQAKSRTDPFCAARSRCTHLYRFWKHTLRKPFEIAWGCLKSWLLFRHPREFKIKSLYSNDLILNIASKSKETVQKLKFLDSPSPERRSRCLAHECTSVYIRGLRVCKQTRFCMEPPTSVSVLQILSPLAFLKIAA